METVEHQLETAKAEVQKPFAQEAELAEKLAHMQEKAGAQNRKPDLEKSDKKKEAVI